MTEHRCLKCQETKPRDDFATNSDGIRSPWCTECSRQYVASRVLCHNASLGEVMEDLGGYLTPGPEERRWAAGHADWLRRHGYAV